MAHGHFQAMRDYVDSDARGDCPVCEVQKKLMRAEQALRQIATASLEANELRGIARKALEQAA